MVVATVLMARQAEAAPPTSIYVTNRLAFYCFVVNFRKVKTSMQIITLSYIHKMNNILMGLVKSRIYKLKNKPPLRQIVKTYETIVK